MANYASLMSGLLSFLAILFVVFGLAEQREQIELEKTNRKKDEIENFRNRLQLLRSLLDKVTTEIVEQGSRMKIFYEAEFLQPTQPNVTHFSANKSFQRVLEMDYMMNYQSIQYFFNTEADWEKMFLNLNSYVDFYSESLLEHRKKYQNHIEDKVKAHKELRILCEQFLHNCVKIVEHYRVEFGRHIYLQQPWAIIHNDFIEPFNNYNNRCREEQTASNFRILSDNHFLPYIRKAMDLRDKVGFDNYGSHEQVELASKIRKKIYEVEMYSVQYAENIKYYYDEYYSKESAAFINFKKLFERLNKKLQSI